MGISEDLAENGYVVIDDFFTQEEIKKMKTEMGVVVDGIDLKEHGTSVFSTYNEEKHAADDYFLNSSDKIRVFFEEGAFDKNHQLIVDKDKALNKIGHGLHWLNETFREMSFHPKIKDLFRQLDFKDPRIVQSMYIFKQPKIGGEVTDHIDATFLYVHPIDHLIGIWIAIDDSTIDNGCLSFIPGSHKSSCVDYRFIRTHDTSGGPLLKFKGIRPTYNKDDFVPLPMKKGSMVVIHGLVVHKSEANTSQHSRHAYTFHVMESNDTQWSPDNWLQETDSYKFPSLYDN